VIVFELEVDRSNRRRGFTAKQSPSVLRRFARECGLNIDLYLKWTPVNLWELLSQ
jgi:hypothetical protein